MNQALEDNKGVCKDAFSQECAPVIYGLYESMNTKFTVDKDNPGAVNMTISARGAVNYIDNNSEALVDDIVNSIERAARKKFTPEDREMKELTVESDLDDAKAAFITLDEEGEMNLSRQKLNQKLAGVGFEGGVSGMIDAAKQSMGSMQNPEQKSVMESALAKAETATTVHVSNAPAP